MAGPPSLVWWLVLALPMAGLALLLARALVRRALGAPPLALLAGVRRRPAQRRPRRGRERGGPAQPGRAALPRLDGPAHECRLPRPARAGNAGRAAERAQCRIRAGHAGRAAAGIGLRRAVLARGRQPRRHGAPARDPDAGRARRRAGGVGSRVARRGAAARPGDRVGAGAMAARPRPVRRRRVRFRRLAVPAALPRTPPTAAARRGGGLRAARRGAGRDGVRPRLAGLVVGVARPHGGGLRGDRARRPARVPQRAVGVGSLRGHLPGPHARAARPAAVGSDGGPGARRRHGHPGRGRRAAEGARLLRRPARGDDRLGARAGPHGPPPAAVRGATSRRPPRRGTGPRAAGRARAGGLRPVRGPRGLHDVRRGSPGHRGHRHAERLLGLGGPRPWWSGRAG